MMTLTFFLTVTNIDKDQKLHLMQDGKRIEQPKYNTWWTAVFGYPMVSRYHSAN